MSLDLALALASLHQETRNLPTAHLPAGVNELHVGASSLTGIQPDFHRIRPAIHTPDVRTRRAGTATVGNQTPTHPTDQTTRPVLDEYSADAQVAPCQPEHQHQQHLDQPLPSASSPKTQRDPSPQSDCANHSRESSGDGLWASDIFEMLLYRVAARASGKN